MYGRRDISTAIALAVVLSGCSDSTAPDNGPSDGNEPPIARFTHEPRIAVEGSPVTFTAQATDPDGTVTAWTWDLGDGAAASDRLPSYDNIVFGEDGRLWIRALGADAPDVHPALYAFTDVELSSHRRWEALDADGHPAGAVLLPRSFNPALFGTDEVWGFRTLETREVVLARASLHR
jgi:hypothetical protein